MEDGSIIIDSSIDTEGAAASSDDLKNILKSIVSACEGLRKSIDSLSATMAKGFKEAGSSAKKAKEEVKDLAEEEAKAAKQAEALENININYGPKRKNKPTEEPRTVQLTGKQGYNQDAIDFIERYSGAIDSLKGKAQQLKNTLREMEASGKYFDNSEEYQDTYLELQNVNGQIREYKRNLDNIAYGGKVDALETQIESLRNKTRNLSEDTRYYELQLKQLASSGQGFGDTAYDEIFQKLQKAKTAEQGYKKSLSESNEEQKRSTKLGNALSQSLGKIAKKLSLVTSKALRAGKSMLMRGVKTAVKRISDGYSRLTKSINGAQKAQNKFGIGRMLKMSLLCNLVFRAMTIVTDAIKDGMISLSQYSNETNRNLSALMSALTQLKNSIATAFAPILSVVTPILTKFINMLSRAITYVGMFIAAITGKESYIRAKKVQQDFADAYGDTADNAKDATDAIKDQSDALNDAAKEAEGYLSPIDEINKVQKKITDSTGSGSGNNSDTPTISPGELLPEDMFEEVPIESSIKNLVKKIKDLIAAEDWDGLGEFLAGKINGIVAKVKDAIDWKNVGPTITKFVTAFTETFNSLVKNVKWDLIGRTIGAGVNTIVNTLNLLITGIDWVELGRKFAEGINNLVDEVEWNNLGQLIGNKFMIAWNIFYGIVSDLEFDKIGIAIAEGLNGVISTIKLETIGATLGKAITGIFTLAVNFAREFKWEELGKNIYEGINAFLTETKWETVGKGISDFVLGLLEAITTAIQGIEWKQVGQAIVDMLNNIDWKALGLQLFEAGLSLIVGLLEAFKQLPKPIQEVIKVIVIFFAAFKAASILKSVVTAITGVIDAIEGAGKMIKYIKPIINGVSKAVSAVISVIGSVVSTLGGPLTLAIIAIIAVLVLLITHWDEVKAAFTQFKEDIVNKWTLMTTAIKEAAKALVDGITEKFNALKEKITNAVQSVSDFINKALNTDWTKYFGDAGKTLNAFSGNVKEIFNGVKEVFSGIIKFVQGVFTGDWKRAWEGVKQAFKGVFDSLVGIIKIPINAIIGAINGLVRGCVNGINAVIDSLNRLNFTIPSWVPYFGGNNFGFNISRISAPQIPYLATGAVIPPNAPFMAVLGDQKSGNNIEAPESLIRKIFREEFRGMPKSGGNYTFSANINRRVLFEELIEEAKLRQGTSGRNPFELG